MTYEEMCEKARTAKNENVYEFRVGFECSINSIPFFRNGETLKNIMSIYFEPFCNNENLKLNIIEQGKTILSEQIRVEIIGHGTEQRAKRINKCIEEIKQEMSMVL